MESLIVDFVQFCSAKLLFLEGREGTRLPLHLIWRFFLNYPHFLRYEVLSHSPTCVATREETRTISLW